VTAKRKTLPEAVCFRVTRYCNARCGFCLAPPDGSHPSEETLLHRLDWIMARGVKTVHFCGGEPTIHPAMPRLLDHVHACGGKTRMTTNGIMLSDALVALLRKWRTDVKVSLHGDRELHNRLVGRSDAFDQTTANVRRLVAWKVPTSIQTTVVGAEPAEAVVDWIAAFCRATGVKRLNLIPFIPRGSGFERRAEYQLLPPQLRALRELVRSARRRWQGVVDVHLLDLSTRPVPVIEADGRIVIERACEALDENLGFVPEPELVPVSRLELAGERQHRSKPGHAIIPD